MVLAHPLVCSFSALRAEKLHTFEMESTAVPELDEGLPKAQCATSVSPNHYSTRAAEEKGAMAANISRTQR
jgi:hypothetical protein